MNRFDSARREILAALFLEYHRNRSGLVGFGELESRYSFRTAKYEWFDPIVSEMEGQLSISQTLDGNVSVGIRSAGFGYVYRELLRELAASFLEVDWSKEEILSDGINYDWFPSPVGWKWLQVASELSDPQSDVVLRDHLDATLVPASDRMVPINHNSQEVNAIADGLAALQEELRSANDLSVDPAERQRLLSSFEAARSLWDSVQLKVIQIRVGIIMTIEDTAKALKGVGKAVGAALLVDMIKAYVKSVSGLNI